MATAKKRTKKTAAAPTASGKANKKAPARTLAGKGASTGKKKESSSASENPAPLRGGGAKKKTTRTADKAPAKKTSAGKAPAKITEKSTTAKTPARKAAAARTPARKTTTGKAKAAPARGGTSRAGNAAVDTELFLPMTEGERAEALRVLLEDPRLTGMASVGRYRVIAVEPLTVKPPHGLAGHRLARVVIYDYASDRSVDACVNLDHGRVAHLNLSRAQPMLAREEEAAAISIALSDDRVKEQLSLGEEPQVAMHYWSSNNANLSFARRSAAVVFGRPDSSPSLIAVVDLLDNLVSEIVPATHW